MKDTNVSATLYHYSLLPMKTGNRSICKYFCLFVNDVWMCVMLVIGHFWSAKITVLYVWLEITKITSAAISFHQKFKDSSHQRSYSSLLICVVRCFEVHIVWVHIVWNSIYKHAKFHQNMHSTTFLSFLLIDRETNRQMFRPNPLHEICWW